MIMYSQLHKKGVLSGLFYILFGFATFGLALGYEMGDAQRMGPGYFPRILAAILIGLGVLTVIQGLRDEERVSGMRIRPVLCIALAVLSFALVDKIGMIPAGIAVVVIASLGSADTRRTEVGLSAVVLTVLSYAIFVHFLGLPLTAWPNFQ